MTLHSPSLSDVFVFQGGGQYFYWMLGLSEHLSKIYNIKNVVMVGVSAGALCAVFATCAVSPHHVLEATKRMYHKYKPNERWFGVMGIWSTGLEEWLEELLPIDAHELCTDKVHILISRFFHQRMVVSKFTNRKELIECLLSTTHIPLFMNYYPFRVFRGYWCFDGELTINDQREYELFDSTQHRYHYVNYKEDETLHNGFNIQAGNIDFFHDMYQKGCEFAKKKYQTLIMN